MCRHIELHISILENTCTYYTYKLYFIHTNINRQKNIAKYRKRPTFRKKQSATKNNKRRTKNTPLTESFANKCPFCTTPKSFSRQNSLSRHLRQSHAREFFEHSTNVAQGRTKTIHLSTSQDDVIDTDTSASSSSVSEIYEDVSAISCVKGM